MLFTAINALSISPLLAASGLGSIIAPWIVRLPKLAVSFLVFSLIAGQLIRFPLPGQGGGLLVSDLAMALIIISASFQCIFKIEPFKKPKNQNPQLKQNPKLKTQTSQTPLSRLCFGRLKSVFCLGFVPSVFWVLSPFILWSLFTLLIRISTLGPINTTIAASYWLRLSTTLLLLPALLVIFSDINLRRFAHRAFIFTITATLLLGVLQYLFFSDFSVLAQLGWDPHQHRLTSTWLDPNFFGGFLVISIWYLVSRAVSSSYSGQRPVGATKPFRNSSSQPVLPLVGSLKTRWAIWLLAAGQFIALLLTQSRSSLISLFIVLVLLSPFLIVGQLRNSLPKVRSQSLFIFSLVILLIIFSGYMLQDRLLGLLSLDPTSSLRLLALQEAWPLAVEHTWLGVGYNAYQFTALKAGLINSFNIHSRAGTDNSILTLWITTGLIGLISFMAPWVYLINKFLLNWWRNPAPAPLLAVGAIATLFVHGQFINSWLYSHLLITLIIITALAVVDLSSPSKK